MIADDEFKKIDPASSAFIIWRIEQFKVVPYPADLYGKFYSGDAYLLYHAVKKGAVVTKDIYFWIGSGATQDEYGTAAIKAVELDKYFDDIPIQHREIESFETNQFLALFEKYGGIHYLEGGVVTGFKSVTSTVITQLFQVKGTKTPSLKQVEAKGTSLNQGDAFILTTKDKVFLWVGKKANLKEVLAAAQVVSKFKLERKLKDVRLDGGETTPEFWAALGGETPIKDASNDDAEFEAKNKLSIYLLKGRTAGAYSLVAEGAAAKPTLLKGKQVYVIHRGHKAVVWLPKGFKVSGGDPLGIAVDAILAPLKLDRLVSVSQAKEQVKSEELDLLFA